MKLKTFFAALLFMVAGMQTAWGQGFRVYKSDGTIAQFSLRTDSIVFYDGIGTDEDFGPFTPVNQMIVGTWYQSKSKTVTFNEDGTTDYMAGATYKFFPYQGTIIIYNASGAPMNILKVHELTAEQMIVTPEGGTFSVWGSTQPVQLVTGITLSETFITLQPDETMCLTATVEPADADNSAVTWASSDDAVAEVNSSGRVTAKAKGTCTITCAATDDSGVKAECQVVVNTDTMEYVDLGLPSGTLWATCNVGANRPEEYGDYFAWGETAPKDEYNWSTYKWMNAGQSSWKEINKYTFADGKTDACWYSNGTFTFVGDGKTELDPEDDAATANWGSGWQMPSLAQIEELYNSNYTTTVWTQMNGVNGRKITSKSNGNSIFLPAAGYRGGTSLVNAGSYGFYWSRSLGTSNSSYAYRLYCSSGYIGRNNEYRHYGQSVRPVRILE